MVLPNVRTGQTRCATISTYVLVINFLYGTSVVCKKGHCRHVDYFRSLKVWLLEKVLFEKNLKLIID